MRWSVALGGAVALWGGCGTSPASEPVPAKTAPAVKKPAAAAAAPTPLPAQSVDPRDAWVKQSTSMFVDQFCAPGGYFSECVSSRFATCKQDFVAAALACKDQMSAEMPMTMDEAADRSWSVRIMMCVNSGFMAKVPMDDTPRCQDYKKRTEEAAKGGSMPAIPAAEFQEQMLSSLPGSMCHVLSEQCHETVDQCVARVTPILKKCLAKKKFRKGATLEGDAVKKYSLEVSTCVTPSLLEKCL